MTKNTTSLKKWGDSEKAHWLLQQQKKRSYFDEVVKTIIRLVKGYEVHQYGSLPYADLGYSQDNYPLYILKSKQWDDSKPNILITGGVHGYETSGVQGALHFLEFAAVDYLEQFNFAVAPCISPWGYETINRWNPITVDPNRSFLQPSPAWEAATLMTYIDSLDITFLAHLDLHETTDTDNSIFRPALEARDSVHQAVWDIPDGFYLVGDSENPTPEFQQAIIRSVEKVTHIAPADDKGEIVGDKLEQHGVINYMKRTLGLCAGFSGVKYSSTTEVYPDSPNVTDEECIVAQVAAVRGALDYLLEH